MIKKIMKSTKFFIKKHNNNIKSRIAVQAHIFFVEVLNEIIDCSNNVSESFDLFITTDTKKKAEYILQMVNIKSKANSIEIMICPNKGRDIAPFLMQMKNKVLEYKYLCHIHAKKSIHTDFGDKWRKYLLDKLLGSYTIVKNIINEFDIDKNIGIMYPPPFDGLIDDLIKHGNNRYIKRLSIMIGIDLLYQELNTFPAGDMFWLRTESAIQLLRYNFNWNDFPDEKGQLDFTIMHAIERVWKNIVEYNGYKLKSL